MVVTLAFWTTGQFCKFRGAGKSFARPASRRILFDGENISFDASLVGGFHPFTGHEGPEGE